MIKERKIFPSVAEKSNYNNNNNKDEQHTVDEDFSPYFAAFSDRLKREIDVYEKLKSQLKYFHQIDWDEISEVKAFESEESN